jgi:dCMP deaminase
MVTNHQYMDIASVISESSYSKRKKVGAILVKDNRIISIGYNGTPSGFENSCEEDNVTKEEVLHAESNCISKCAKSNESSLNSDLYVTMSPCIECAKLIIQSGIKRVFYREKYIETKGLELLQKAKIEINEI